jgi:hypothetical protein
MAQAERTDRLGVAPFVVGGLSFIPLLGVLFGVVAIVWALATKRAGRGKLALIGLGGIGFTFVVYGALFYVGFAQRGGVYDDLRAELARSGLNTLVESVEFYRVQYGYYPESLEKLRSSLPKQSIVLINDPTDIEFGKTSRLFYYQRVDDGHYYLRGVGRDGIPFTPDDILPQITATPGSRIGLLIDVPAGGSNAAPRN